MFVLLWATLFITLTINNTAADQNETKDCKDRICVSIKTTAEAGLCIVIPCKFSTDPRFKMESAVWCKRNSQKCHTSFPLNQNNQNAQSVFGGRMSQLEPDLSSGNCSIMINSLTKEDSGQYQLKFTGDLNGAETESSSHEAELEVQELTQKPTVTVPPLTEGQQSTLTCTAPGLCSGPDPEITWMWRGTGGNHSHITGNVTSNQGRSSTLTFNASDVHHGSNITCKVSFTGDVSTEETVTLNVTYIRMPQITGNTTVKEGNPLSLTCRVDSFPPSNLTWTKLGFSKNLNNETETNMATLVIPNVTADDFGRYICTAKHLTAEVNIKVSSNPKILNNSTCLQLSDVLTCMCISQGFPLPTITWPMLENHMFYSVITAKSNHSVNSTVSLAVTDQQSAVVQCVSSNDNGVVKKNLNISTVKQEEEDQYMKWLKLLIQLEIIVAFLTGALLSAFICCLVIKCHRRKHKTVGNPVEALEMVTSHEDPLIDTNQAEGGGAAAAAVVGKQEVEYSNLDFSLIKSRSPETGVTTESTETEYAEIKKEDMEERQDGEGTEKEEEQEEVAEVVAEVVLAGEDDETKQSVSDEKVDEEMALYSNMKDIMENEDSIT